MSEITEHNYLFREKYYLISIERYDELQFQLPVCYNNEKCPNNASMENTNYKICKMQDIINLTRCNPIWYGVPAFELLALYYSGSEAQRYRTRTIKCQYVTQQIIVSPYTKKLFDRRLNGFESITGYNGFGKRMKRG